MIDDVPDPFLVWAYTPTGSLLTLSTYVHIEAGTLRLWVVKVSLNAACAVTLWLRRRHSLPIPRER